MHRLARCNLSPTITLYNKVFVCNQPKQIPNTQYESNVDRLFAEICFLYVCKIGILISKHTSITGCNCQRPIIFSTSSEITFSFQNDIWFSICYIEELNINHIQMLQRLWQHFGPFFFLKYNSHRNIFICSQQQIEYVDKNTKAMIHSIAVYDERQITHQSLV